MRNRLLKLWTEAIEKDWPTGGIENSLSWNDKVKKAALQRAWEVFGK